MNVVYAESSAVLAWLLGEPRQKDVIKVLVGADQVVTSTLTAIECGRALARAKAMGRVEATGERAGVRLLDDALVAWHTMDISDEVIARARQAFPVEPVRTLDAVHLATAFILHELIGAVQMLSLDDRVRTNAAVLGMLVSPSRQ